MLVKAPLRVLYDKIQHDEWGQVANTARGEAECCICHETPPIVMYFIVQHEYTVLLLICWFCVGELVSIFCSDGSGAMLLGRLVLYVSRRP